MTFDSRLICLLISVGVIQILHVVTENDGGTTLPVNLDYKMIVRLRAGFVIYRKLAANVSREFLLLKMEDEKEWTCPEGLVESGESEDDAAERNLKEFTGLLLNDIVYAFDYKKVITHGDVPVNTTMFRVGELTYNKFITPHAKSEEYKWSPLKEATKIVNDISKRALLAVDDYLTDMNC